MTLTSSAFQDGEMLPKKYTGEGDNKNPPLTIGNPPDGVDSYILIVTDPDAPMGIFTHWVVWNIPGDTTEITEGQLPIRSIEGTNSAGKIGYFGAMPPVGDKAHRYIFSLYAMPITLELDSSVEREYLERAMTDMVLEECSLTGIYQR